MSTGRIDGRIEEKQNERNCQTSDGRGGFVVVVGKGERKQFCRRRRMESVARAERGKREETVPPTVWGSSVGGSGVADNQEEGKLRRGWVNRETAAPVAAEMSSHRSLIGHPSAPEGRCGTYGAVRGYLISASAVRMEISATGVLLAAQQTR